MTTSVRTPGRQRGTSVWRSRGVLVALAGTVVAMLVALAAHPLLPETVVQHGDFGRPDAWTSRDNALVFHLLFLPGVAAFLMLTIIGTTALGPGALNLSDPAQLAYWSDPEHWPEARRRSIDTMGVFTAAFVVVLAVLLVLGAGGSAWGLPFWTTWAIPLPAIGLVLWWLVRALNRAFRIPDDIPDDIPDAGPGPVRRS